MERGAPVDLEYTKRFGALVAQHAIQDVFDVMVELITNCDDSYHGLFLDGHAPQDGGPILIEVEARRGDRPSVVTVRDRAAGISNLARKLQRVGERTSRAGDRGFMARGLKDCAALGHVTVETIVNGWYDKAEITPTMQFIPWTSGRKPGREATQEDRDRLGLKRGNGTVVRIELEPHLSVPRLETLKRELPWHYALRDIMTNGSGSTVRVSYGGSTENLSWVQPDAELVHDREYPVPGYEGARLRFRLWKAREPLADPADRRCRRTGILVKGRRAIHGVSFLASDLESDPAAENYFGRLDCDAIDDLAEDYSGRLERGASHSAENPTFLLDPNRRGGLEERHPFTRALYQQPIEILKQEFKKHKEAERERRKRVEAKETTERLRRLAREASRFMREKLEEAGALGAGEEARTKSFAKKGVGVSPAFTQIEVGATRMFTVRASKELDIPLGTLVKVGLSKSAERAVALVGSPTDLDPDPIHDDLLRGSFILRGIRVAGIVQVRCQVDGLDAVFTEVQVVEPGPVEIDIPGGFAFQRKNYTVRPGSQKRLFVRARFDRPMAVPPAVRFTVADDSVVTLRHRQALQLVPGTTYYEGSITVEGKKINGRTIVTADLEDRSARCSISVAPREEEGIELSFQLVPYSLGQNYRASWDREEPNKLLITTQHESISRYLGDPDQGYPGQHSDAFRVLLAELISDNVCRRIVQEHARALPMEVDSDKVYLLHNKLMREFTPIAHRIQLASPATEANA